MEQGITTTIAISQEKQALSEKMARVQSYVRQKPGPKPGYVKQTKNPSALARRFKQRGLIWEYAFADAIKAAGNFDLPPKNRAQAKADISMWLRLVPFLITSSRPGPKMRKWTGKASNAAKIALEAMEKGTNA